MDFIRIEDLVTRNIDIFEIFFLLILLGVGFFLDLRLLLAEENIIFI
jgi:hypothetical protein